MQKLDCVCEANQAAFALIEVAEVVKQVLQFPTSENLSEFNIIGSYVNAEYIISIRRE